MGHNCHCARRTKDSDEYEFALRQRKTTAPPAIKESPISSPKAGSVRGGFITRLF